MKKYNEETLLKTPVFDVVKKSFEGTTFQPVGINAKDWVMVVAYNKEKDPVCVFVKQTRWGIEEKTIEFPCGTIESNESSRDAAAREFEEETGIRIDSSKLNYWVDFNPNPAYFKNRLTVYGICIPNLIREYCWRGKQNLDKNEDCKVFIEHISVLKDEPVMKNHALSYLAMLEFLKRLESENTK